MKRPDNIENYLSTIKTGTWFGFTDSKNKTYDNLIIHDGSTKPTEKECTDGLAALQAEWDELNKEYKTQRVSGIGNTSGYPNFATQLDQLYHDMKDGKHGVAATTGSWFVGITSVKTAIAKT